MALQVCFRPALYRPCVAAVSTCAHRHISIRVLPWLHNHLCVLSLAVTAERTVDVAGANKLMSRFQLLFVCPLKYMQVMV